jgi:hypothetical protein
MRPYLQKSLHKKVLVEWLKVRPLSSNPNITHKKKEVSYCVLGLVSSISFKNILKRNLSGLDSTHAEV